MEKLIAIFGLLFLAQATLANPAESITELPEKKDIQVQVKDVAPSTNIVVSEIEENPLIEEDWTDKEIQQLVKMIRTSSDEEWAAVATDLKDMGTKAENLIESKLNSNNKRVRSRAEAFLAGNFKHVESQGIIFKEKNKETGKLETVSSGKSLDLTPEPKADVIMLPPDTLTIE